MDSLQTIAQVVERYTRTTQTRLGQPMRVRFSPWALMKISAGLLMYRRRGDALEVFLVHPGGPFFANKDKGVWSIPKGEVESGEDRKEVAMRELQEETGIIA